MDEQSLNVLTFFEGNEYQAEMVNVETENGKLNATAFIWKGNTKLLSETDWDWNEFERDSLEIYCEKIIPETILEYSQIKG